MNGSNVFDNQFHVEYHSTIPPMLYPRGLEMASNDTRVSGSDNNSLTDDSIYSEPFDTGYMKAPIAGLYHHYNAQPDVYYKGSVDDLHSYGMSEQNDFINHGFQQKDLTSGPGLTFLQQKLLHKQLRACRSFDVQSDHSSSSPEFEPQGNKLLHASLSFGQTPYFNKNLFRPIKSRVPSVRLSNSAPILWSETESSSPSSDSVELIVGNLDYNISPREWKEILYSTFRSAVMVMNVTVKTQADNSNLGIVRVPTIEDARFAISQFHRKKIGYKRIHVSLKTEEGQNSMSNMRAEVIMLLKEAKGHVLPLFKFIELFDRRYHRSITVSELYKMRDILEIREQGGAGRMIHLTAAFIASQESDAELQDCPEASICPVHCLENSAEYEEVLSCNLLPNVNVKLHTLSAQLHTLLQKHEGSIPMMSFPICYGLEIYPLEVLENSGVNLEHLISCIPGIRIITGKTGIKRVQYAESRPIHSMMGNICSDVSEHHPHTPPVTPSPSSPALTQQLCQISREVVDLLKHTLQCRMPFSKFIPAYHHHFGRQCRVADYGYTKLVELFDAIPHVLQILGTGEKKMLTLSHRAQIRRFTSDLLRVLKVQTNKMLALSEFPTAYFKTMEKQWDVTEYGVCYIEDLVSEIPSTTVLVSEDVDPILLIPRRDQTPGEIARTKQFSREVVDLIQHNPLCEMAFNKFIPSYHHHFGRQCKVADYGFVKLIELFEAIPHIVEIDEEGEERMLHLTEPERLRIFADQITSLLKSSPDQMMLLLEVEDSFNHLYDSPFDLGSLSLEQILGMLKHQFQVELHSGRKFLAMKTAHGHCPLLAQQIISILTNHSPPGTVSLPLKELCSCYKKIYDVELNCSELPLYFDYVQVTGAIESAVISLSPLQEFSQSVRTLLKTYGNLPLSDFENAFHEHYSIEVKPALYNCSSVLSILSAISNVVSIQGNGSEQTLTLTDEFKASVPVLLSSDSQSELTDSGSSLNGSVFNMQEDELNNENSLAKLQVSRDILCGPLPPGLPSPVIAPQNDLINLNTPPDSKDYLTLTDEEKSGLKTPLYLKEEKAPKKPLIRTSKLEVISSTPVDHGNLQRTYSSTVSGLISSSLKTKPISRQSSIENNEWPALQQQIATNHQQWHNGNIPQMDPMLHSTQAPMSLGSSMTAYPTSYWQPAYHPNPPHQLYNSQNMQNLAVTFGNAPLALNSQYQSVAPPPRNANQSIHYAPGHPSDHDFVHRPFPYMFHDTSPLDIGSCTIGSCNDPKKSSPRKSRIAAKFPIL